MTPEHEQALHELHEFRGHVLNAIGRISKLPPEPSRSATARGDGFQTTTNKELPPVNDSRATINDALANLINAIDGYLANSGTG